MLEAHKNPDSHIDANIIGFLIFKLSKKYKLKHLIYASSSSVYGAKNMPYSIDDKIDKPVSLYAEQKLQTN